LVKASQSGKVVCLVEFKWVFAQDHIFSILFSDDKGIRDKGIRNARESAMLVRSNGDTERIES
jgi:hypothetical protein